MPGYQSILQRLCSTSTVTTIKQREQIAASEAEAQDQADTQFDLGFISHAQFDISLNHDVVRSVLFSPAWTLRLNYMHQFLTSHLPTYAAECVAVYPPPSLHLGSPDGAHTSLEIIRKEYHGNKYVPMDAPADAQPGEGILPPGEPQINTSYLYINLSQHVRKETLWDRKVSHTKNLPGF